MINTNKKFPDMKALCDYVHGKGLKTGIYSSPGPMTCAGFTASYEHEEQDARSYAEWGFDYLKYDWCSYGDDRRRTTSLRELHEALSGHAAARWTRSIATSSSASANTAWATSGNGAREVGGNCWRTTGDISDSWAAAWPASASARPATRNIAGPGHWNDPDMLVVGTVGWGRTCIPRA